MGGDKRNQKIGKRFEELDKAELWGVVANKICNAVFSAGGLVQRAKVFKKEERMLKRKLIENIAADNQYEAFAYAKTILIEKRKMAWMLELAERTIDYTNFFKSQMDDMDKELFDSLDRISYLVSSGFLSELDKEITNAEQSFGYIKIKEEMALLQGIVLKKVDTRVTKRQVRAYLKKVKNDPKVISALTVETSKLKSTFDLRSRSRSRKSRSIFRL